MHDEKGNAPIYFTTEQLYEVNDAIAETVNRMLTKGQTKSEVENNSLAVLLEVRKQIMLNHFGKWETPAMLDIAPIVDVAIRNPKMLDREHAYQEKFGQQ